MINFVYFSNFDYLHKHECLLSLKYYQLIFYWKVILIILAWSIEKEIYNKFLLLLLFFMIINLWSFKWLKFNLRRVSNLRPHISCIASIGCSFGLEILNCLEDPILRISSSNFSHSFNAIEKKRIIRNFSSCPNLFNGCFYLDLVWKCLLHITKT